MTFIASIQKVGGFTIFFYNSKSLVERPLEYKNAEITGREPIEHKAVIK